MLKVKKHFVSKVLIDHSLTVHRSATKPVLSSPFHVIFLQVLQVFFGGETASQSVFWSANSSSGIWPPAKGLLWSFLAGHSMDMSVPFPVRYHEFLLYVFQTVLCLSSSSLTWSYHLNFIIFLGQLLSNLRTLSSIACSPF